MMVLSLSLHVEVKADSIGMGRGSLKGPKNMLDDCMRNKNMTRTTDSDDGFGELFSTGELRASECGVFSCFRDVDFDDEPAARVFEEIFGIVFETLDFVLSSEPFRGGKKKGQTWL
jgi:hypothetical protein